jgi:hypothetical protein
MASHTKTSFAGPFTVRCPTCPPIPTELTSIRFTAHLPTSAPLSGPGHHGSVSGQLPSNGHLEEQPHRCGFLSAFAHRHSLLGHPVPARGFRHSLRLAYRTATAAQTLSGFPRSAHVRNDRGGCLFTPGQRCRPGHRDLHDRRLPLHSGQPLPPLQHPIGEGWDHEAYEDSLAFTRPVFPSPVVPGWNGDPSASSPGFAPHGHP